MSIDSDFQKNRKKIGKEEGVAIWGPVSPPEKLGIRGTYVAVDWDICTGCGVCLKVCPRQLFGWVETSGHPTSEKKAFPARESDCVECFKCETKCPTQAIRIVYPGPITLVRASTDRSILVRAAATVAIPLFLLQIIGGVIYGLLFGPYFKLEILFYLGWIVLAIALPLFFSLIMYFQKSGKPQKGKSLMDTTVLVDTGTYAIVRHPYMLGSILLISASILISQHWLAAIIGVPMLVWAYLEAVVEEKGLIIKFGDDYRRYMQKVPRMNFLLGIIRLIRRRQKERI